MLLVRKTRAVFHYRRERLARCLRILRAAPHYRRLLLHDRLNYRFRQAQYAPPPIETIAQDENWRQLAIGDIRFYWPREYAIRGLRGIYRDIFTPADSNPHAYESGEVVIQPGDWVVDAGACEGYFTTYALRRGANVLMIEPVPRLAEALALTFAQEIKAGRVVLLPAGLADHNGQAELSIPRHELFAASTGRLTSAEPAEIDRVTVPVYTLDHIAQEKLIPQIDFLKMDVEGAEVSAFQGAAQLLRTQSPRLSIAVYHAYPNAHTIRALVRLAQPGYHIRYRGIFIQAAFGPPRPFMLHGVCRGSLSPGQEAP